MASKAALYDLNIEILVQERILTETCSDYRDYTVHKLNKNFAFFDSDCNFRLNSIFY